MLSNYFKIAWRNLWRNKVFGLINVFGLTAGLTAAAIVILYSRHERGYDFFHPEPDQTYRISGKHKFNDTWFASLPIDYSNALYSKTFPEPQTIVRIRLWEPKFIRYEDHKIYEEHVLTTDPGSAFFRLFNFQFIQGNALTALEAPNSVVITSSFGREIFGNDDPMGKSIAYDTLRLVVTGVLKDLPSNSHFNFKVLFTNAPAMENAYAAITYAAFSPNTDITGFKKKLLSLPEPSNKFDLIEDVAIIPISDLHFQANMTYEMKPPGNERYFLSFVFTGIMIVILSCVNYMNLSVALYAERRKEIAVRKVAGAGNAGLALQFLTEAVCLSFACLPFALLFTEWMLPWFNQLMDVRLQNDFVRSLPDFSLLACSAAAMGIVAGAYPAWVLPRLKAVMLFKKEKIFSKTGLGLRQVLVAFQVAVLVLVISAGGIIYKQLSYVQDADLGFQKEGILKLKGAWWVDSSQYHTLKGELLRHHAIQQVSNGFAPGDEEFGFAFKVTGTDAVYNDLITFVTDHDYLETLGLDLLQADFDRSPGKKSGRQILINETLARRLGPDALGRQITLSPGEQERVYTINGVFRDYHFFSLHRPVAPMMLRIQPYGAGQNLLIKIQTGDLSRTLDFIKKKAAEMIPGIPLVPEFLDDSLGKLYDKEQKLLSLVRQLLLAAALLSVIGLAGLAGYMGALRTREIGIRKVLGATVFGIVAMLSRDFAKLVLIAILIASPVAWWAMNKWLESFAYRVEIHWWMFAAAGLVAAVIALLTVSWQAIRAAVANPVKSLRTE